MFQFCSINNVQSRLLRKRLLVAKVGESWEQFSARIAQDIDEVEAQLERAERRKQRRSSQDAFTEPSSTSGDTSDGDQT